MGQLRSAEVGKSWANTFGYAQGVADPRRYDWPSYGIRNECSRVRHRHPTVTFAILRRYERSSDLPSRHGLHQVELRNSVGKHLDPDSSKQYSRRRFDRLVKKPHKRLAIKLIRQVHSHLDSIVLLEVEQPRGVEGSLEEQIAGLLDPVEACRRVRRGRSAPGQLATFQRYAVYIGQKER